MKKYKRLINFLLAIIFIFAVGYSVYKQNKGNVVQKNEKTTVAPKLKESTKAQSTKSQDTSAKNNENQNKANNDNSSDKLANIKVEENGSYNTKLEVAKYLATYNKLPKNYLTKNEAMKKGWDPQSGNLDKVLKGYSIGGDTFSNFEGVLPKGNGIKYTECDIDYNGGKRNAKRIVFNNKGEIYYTEDHYKTFEKLN